MTNENYVALIKNMIETLYVNDLKISFKRYIQNSHLKFVPHSMEDVKISTTSVAARI